MNNLENRFEVIAEVARGKIAKVCRCRDQGGKVFVAKIFPKSNAASKAFKKEVAMCEQAKADFFCESFETSGEYVITMKDCGTALSRICESNERPSTENLQKILFQMCSVVKALHSQDICHGDIKPDNFVMDNAEKVTLIDFGLSEFLPNDGKSKSTIGTPQYLPPEVLKEDFHTNTADIWALGVTLYSLAAGELPFPSSTRYEEYCLVLETEPDMTKIQAEYGEGLADLIKSMLNKDSTERPSADECLRSDWFGREYKFLETTLVEKVLEYPVVAERSG